MSAPFSACIAREASALDISTKPKPRGRPVSRSVIRETFSTVPCFENRARTASSVAEKGRLPTYSLVTADIQIESRATHYLRLLRTAELYCPRRSDLLASLRRLPGRLRSQCMQDAVSTAACKRGPGHAP